MNPFETRLVIAAVLICAGVVLALIYRKHRRTESLVLMALSGGILIVPMIARALERML
jgi:hypothetical protein